MKKMKRLLVAILSGLTAIACIAGVSACKNSADKDSSADKAPVESVVPDTNININLGGDPVVCVHDYSVVYQEVAATCDEEGYILKGCSKCGVELLVNTKKIPHDFAGATCADGNAECVACGEVKYESVDCTWVEATCTEDAYCSVCGAVDLGTAKGHDYVDATCTAAGYCSVCNEENAADPKHWWASAFGTLVEDGELASGFTLAVEEGVYYVEDNCVDNTVGYEAFDFCLTCLKNYMTIEAPTDLALKLIENDKAKVMEYLFGSGKIATEGYAVIPVEHNMVDAFEVDDEGNVLGIAPDCVTKGITANFQYCEDCSNMETVAKTFAAYDAFVNAKATVNGVEVLVNVTAGYETVDALGHTWEYEDADGNIQTTYKAGKEATCTVAGATWSATCTRTGCGHVVNSTPIAKYDHKVNGEYAFASEPTCAEAGVCALCETTPAGVSAFAKKAHTYGAAQTKAATCTETGYTNLKICTACGDTVAETLWAPKGHSWTRQNPVAANCGHGASVEEYYKCTACSEYALKDATTSAYVVVAESDIYVGGPVGEHKSTYVEATCTKPASGVDCVVCGAKNYVNAPVDEEGKLVALGHTPEVEPTCTEAGKCAIESCKAVLPALGHKWTVTEKVNPTCDAEGNVRYAVCDVCNDYAIVSGNSTYSYVTEIGNTGMKVDVNYYDHIVLPATGHNFVAYAEVLSTCTVAGHSAYEACKNCGYKVGYVDYAKVSCASDIKSCADKVACNCSYLKLNDGTVVAYEGWYKKVDGVWTLVEEGTAGAVEAVWAGCGELTDNMNKIDCVGHDKNGLCLVCGKEVAHSFVEGECTICGKEEQERQ